MDTGMPADFALSAKRVRQAYVVAPAGELDLGTVDEVRDALQALPEGCRLVVLDLRELTFFDTSGMRLIVETLERTSAQEIGLAIVRGPEDVQRLFQLAGLDQRLPFCDDLDEALRHR